MHGTYNTRKLNVQEKSRGVVLFAFNTKTVNYVSIAIKSAQLIHKSLNLPVTLITDETVDSPIFDNVVYCKNTLSNVRKGYENLTTWRNGNRYNAYELTPYTETLLIDSDYLMLDDSLGTLFDCTSDYQIMKHNKYLSLPTSESMSPVGLNQVWATAILFKKTQKARELFMLAGKIQRNYGYYRKLYSITATNFRNDYAFAIANNIINGDITNFIPWSMLTASEEIENLEILKNNLIVREESKAHVIPKQNIHIMDKKYLLSDSFAQFVENICA